MSDLPVNEKIKVLLIDDHPITLRGIKDYLRCQVGIEIVGEAYNGTDGVQLAKALSPDIVLMDINLPMLDGIQAARTLKSQSPQVKVLFLSMHDSRYYLDAFLESGAKGFVLKSDPPEELMSAIEAVYHGKAYFSPTHSQMILEEYSSGKTAPPSKLTDHEAKIVILIAKGMNNKEIAEVLCSNSRTIEKHRNRIMDKLNLHSAVDLTRYAIAMKLVEAEI